MKCLREKGQGPRIDQYFLRSQSSQSNEIQRQEANHSSQDISTPVIDVRRTCMDTVSDEPNDPCEPGQTNQHKREKNLNGHKPGVKWPRACEKTAWNTVNTDLCFALERLSGTVEKKLDKFGDIIYAYGSERFGVEKRKEKVQTIPGKSRRQQEIERLVRERRQLRKQWRRAEQSQKEGLNLLQRVIKDKLATSGRVVDVGAVRQIAANLIEIADQLDQSVVSRASGHLARRMQNRISQDWTGLLSSEVECMMRQGIPGLQQFPQEKVMLTLTMVLVQNIGVQAPTLLRSFFSTAVQYINENLQNFIRDQGGWPAVLVSEATGALRTGGGRLGSRRATSFVDSCARALAILQWLSVSEALPTGRDKLPIMACLSNFGTAPSGEDAATFLTDDGGEPCPSGVDMSPQSCAPSGEDAATFLTDDGGEPCPSGVDMSPQSCGQRVPVLHALAADGKSICCAYPPLGDWPCTCHRDKTPA
ncbi:UNVERIFIED_CONTAM: hypothetical protein FKN15_044740 [Acipenser sinensis]